MKRAAALIVLTLAGSAHADVQARATLVYEVARGCPTEADLRAAVGTRLGYDPFVGSAGTEVAVHVTPQGRGVQGRLDIGGPRPGSREIASPNGDCREVIDALATAIAISLDPASLTRPPDAPPPPPAEPPAPAPAPAPVVAPPVVAAPPPKRATAPPPKERVHPSFGAAGALLVGELPHLAPGVDVWVGGRYRFFRAAIEGSFSAAATEDERGKVSATLLTGALVPCFVYDVLSGCFVGRLGSLRGTGSGVDVPEHASALYGTMGARAGLEVPVYRTLSVRAYGELVVPTTRVSLALGGTDVWTTSTVAGRFGVGLGLQL